MKPYKPMFTEALTLTGVEELKDDMRDSLPNILKSEDGFDDSFEVAVYWLANDYHSGQFSKGYELLSSSPYEPGRLATKESNFRDDELAKMIYDELVDLGWGDKL